MAVSPGNSRAARASRTHLPLTPAVTTVRRGSHSPVAPSENRQPAPAIPAAGLTLISSARGVRLSRSR